MWIHWIIIQHHTGRMWKHWISSHCHTWHKHKHWISSHYHSGCMWKHYARCYSYSTLLVWNTMLDVIVIVHCTWGITILDVMVIVLTFLRNRCTPIVIHSLTGNTMLDVMVSSLLSAEACRRVSSAQWSPKVTRVTQPSKVNTACSYPPKCFLSAREKKSLRT